jgi:hypothetical protein
MTSVEAYLQAFSKHYPAKTVSIRGKRQQNGGRMYAVLIDGDSGGMLLSENDLREATRMFNK